VARIRSSESPDIPWLVPQLFAFLASTGLPFNPTREHAEAALKRLMDRGVVLVAEDEKTGELMGTIGGTIDWHLFDPSVLVLAELWWWVPQEHRGSDAGLLLLQAFRQRGLEDVDVITMSTLETTHPGIGRHLEAMGFQRREQAYMLFVEPFLRQQRSDAREFVKPTEGVA